MLKASPDLYLWLDERGVILKYHSGDPSSLSVPLEHLIGKRLDQALPAEIARTLDAAVTLAQSSTAPVALEYTSGSRHFEAAVVALGSGQVLVHSREVTDRKRAEAKVRRTNEMLNTLIQTSPLAIGVLDKRGNVIVWNRAAEQLFGWTEEEVIDRPLPIVPEHERAAFHSQLERELQGELRKGLELRRVRKDGTTVPVSLWTTPLYDLRNEVIGVIGMFADNTERERTLEALRNSEESLRLILNSVCDAIFIHHLDGTIIDVNEKMLELYGVTREEALASPVLFFSSPDNPFALAPQLWSRALAGEPQLFEWKARRPHDGATFDVEVFLRRIQLDLSDAIMASVRDITERKRVEEQLREGQRMKVLGQLAAGVAHEVRNPLNAIIAVTEALVQDLGSAQEYKPFLDHIHIQVNRLSTLMRELLDLGKPIRPAQLYRESLVTLCSAAIELWSRSTAHKGRCVRLVAPPAGTCSDVVADGARLQQVVLNLIENAAQHSPEASEITVEIAATPKTVQVRIIDRGTGIAQDALPRVFEPFFTLRKGGTGLGLSVVKHIVQSLGGEVTIGNNDPPPGCTASFTLPAAENAAAGDAAA
ncbi:MAG: PAS domain S-box protein [Nitrospirota bacterium]